MCSFYYVINFDQQGIYWVHPIFTRIYKNLKDCRLSPPSTKPNINKAFVFVSLRFPNRRPRTSKSEMHPIYWEHLNYVTG
jgi:hypothetical protein